MELRTAIPVDDRFRLYNLSVALGIIEDFGRNVSREGYGDEGGLAGYGFMLDQKQQLPVINLQNKPQEMVRI